MAESSSSQADGNDSQCECSIALDSLDPFDYDVLTDSRLPETPPTDINWPKVDFYKETESSSVADCYSGEMVFPEVNYFDPVVAVAKHKRRVVLDNLDPFDYEISQESQLIESPCGSDASQETEDYFFGDDVTDSKFPDSLVPKPVLPESLVPEPVLPECPPEHTCEGCLPFQNKRPYYGPISS